MLYFLTVNTKSATTKLGKIMAEKVMSKYDSSLISSESLASVISFIERCQTEVIAASPRLKPMELHMHGVDFSTPGQPRLIPLGAPQIWMASPGVYRGDCDNRPFTIYFHPVYHDYSKEGGAQ